MADKRFRYAFNGLLRKRQWDWTTVKVEEAAAAKIVDRRSAEVDQVRGTIALAERLLRESCASGASIDPDQQQLVARYLSQQRNLLKTREQALDKAKAAHQQVVTNLATIGSGIKSLEKHRGHKQVEHELQAQATEQTRVDELWLIAQRKR